MAPDLLLCDGHGILHPRKLGEATQLGLALEIPAIGIAKRLFVGECDQQGFIKRKGENRPIFLDDRLRGYAVCLHTGSKPVYLSPGYQISLQDALVAALSIQTNHRQPEPLFLADRLSRQAIQNELRPDGRGFS